MTDSKPDFIDAEVLEEITTPDLSDIDEYKGPRKKPVGTRKKDFPSFTPEVRETILQVTSLGAPPQYAAKYAGVSPSTLFRWLERGRAAQAAIDDGREDDLAPIEKDFAAFFSNYNKTVATAVIGILGNLQRAARNNPHVALKLLEKLDPEQFGQRQAIDMNVAGRVGVGHLHVNARDLVDGGEIARQLTTEELRALRESIKKRKQLKAGSKDGGA